MGGEMLGRNCGGEKGEKQGEGGEGGGERGRGEKREIPRTERSDIPGPVGRRRLSENPARLPLCVLLIPASPRLG